MNRKNAVFTAVAACALCYGTAVNAGIFGAGLSGVLQDAVLGRLIDGRSGARPAAITGGLIGAARSAAGETRTQPEQQAIQQRQAEWESRLRAEQEHIRASQPERRAQPAQSQ